MGSFNATCIISNLPIEAGTPVRFFLLTASKYNRGNDHVCYVWGRWQLRGAALRAEYNDYGSVENLEDSLVTRAMFEALSRDAIEKGVGDNQCHDVQVRPGMSEKEWLEALWEGRVFVQDKPFRFNRDWKPPEPEAGIPSLTRLEKLFSDNGLKTVTAFGADGYFMDEVSRGFIRVRHQVREGLDALERALPLLHGAGYAAMITCGTGNYAEPAEILVAPKPGSVGHIFTTGVGEAKDYGLDPRPVAQVLVREDVWQILLQMKLPLWDKSTDFRRMKQDALVWLGKVQAAKKDPLSIEEDFDPDNLFADAISGGEGVAGYSLKSALKLGINLATNEDELQQYVLDLAEMAYVQMIYGRLHGQWHPTTNSGQEARWKEHRTFLRKLLKVEGSYEDG